MPDEMLSILAGGSTPGFVKSVTYDTIEVPKSEIRKIAHDAQTMLSTSDRMMQRSSIGFLYVAMDRLVMGGRLWKDTYRRMRNAICERGEQRQSLHLAASSIGAAKPNAEKRCTGSVLKCEVHGLPRRTCYSTHI